MDETRQERLARIRREAEAILTDPFEPVDETTLCLIAAREGAVERERKSQRADREKPRLTDAQRDAAWRDWIARELEEERKLMGESVGTFVAELLNESQSRHAADTHSAP